MAHGRWRRFLPDRSQLWIPVAILVLVVAAVGFVNLASTRSAAEAKRNAAADKVEQLTEQRKALAAEAAEAAAGGSGEVDAHGYFGVVRPGETRIVAETAGPTPTPAPAAQSNDGGNPGWLEWLRRLVNP